MPIIQVQSVPAPPVFPTAAFLEGITKNVDDDELKRARIDNQHQAILDRALARKAALLKASGAITPLDILKAQTRLRQAEIQHLRGQTDANADYHGSSNTGSQSTTDLYSLGSTGAGGNINLSEGNSATDDLGGLWAGGTE